MGSLECAVCHRPLRVSGILPGTVIDCPYCGTRAVVPAVDVGGSFLEKGPAESHLTDAERAAVQRFATGVVRLERIVVVVRLAMLVLLGVVIREGVELGRGRIGWGIFGPYLLAVPAIGLAWLQAGALMFHLGVWKSPVRVNSLPLDVFNAGCSVIINLVRVALCFGVSWPVVAPVITATLAIKPVLNALAAYGVLGGFVERLVMGGAEEGRVTPAGVLAASGVWIAGVAGLTAAAWYFLGT